MSRFHRGGTSFQKPENALKRAEELVAVGQPASALQTLHDVITSKRHRTWQKVLEQIMMRYIDLCVDLKKGRYAKDGLIHYRNVCQQVNVSSLEEVIKYFLKTATDKAEAAQSQADTALTLDVEDLEVDATPEDLMLSYVSGEKGKDRTDRELVTPWFKFLWETYRTILDVLRNNSRLESLYAMTAARAFNFCLVYKRTTEFRRLCDILRNHLTNLNKYRDQKDRPDLTNPESLQLYLESRFEQLKVACELELWQEAFRSVEDIQGLIVMGKKPIKTQMMAVYYAKLAKIFTVSESHLYNGYAWYKLFNLARTYNKNLSATDVSQLSCNVLLSALSIPPYEPAESARTEAEVDLEKDRSVRMATILGFSVDSRRDPRQILSRNALVSELAAKGILNLVPEPVKQLYAVLEQDFSPLQLCRKLAPLLEQLDGLNKPLSSASPVQDAPLGNYRKSLEQVAILRLLQQLGQVYSVMKIDSLKALVPFANFGEVEQIIVEAVKNDFIKVRIDHRNGTVHFGGLEVESDQLRDHIAVLTKRLTKAVGMIYPAQNSEREARRLQAVRDAIASATRDNERMLARKSLIEKKKEEQERLLLQAEKEEEEKRLIQARLSEAAEEERRRQDRLKREEDRIAREMAEREEEEARAMLEQAAKQGKIKLPAGEKLDKAALLNQVRTEQQRAKEEAEKKLSKYIRQLDHFERARRDEEAPLLEAAYQKKVAEDAVLFEEEQARFAVLHREAWEADIKEKQRMQKMVPYKDQLAAQIQSRRADEFERLKRERDARLKQLKEERHQKRERARKEEYVARCKQEIEMRRLKEQAEAMQREEEQKAREEAERKRKLEEAAERQRRREQEIEEKLRKEKEEALKAGPAAAPAAAAGRPGFVPPALRAKAAAEGGSAEEADRWTRRTEQPAAAPAAAPAASAATVESGPSKWRPSGGPRRDTEAPPSADTWKARSREAPRNEPDARPPSSDRWSSKSRTEGRPGAGPLPPARDGPPRPGAGAPPTARAGPPRPGAPSADGPPRPSGERWQPQGRAPPAPRNERPRW